MENFIIPADLGDDFLLRPLTRLGISKGGFGGNIQITEVKTVCRGQALNLSFYVKEWNPGLPLRPGENGMLMDFMPGIYRYCPEDYEYPAKKSFSLITRDCKSPPAEWGYKGEYELQKAVPVAYEQVAANLGKVC
jgi:hypothetical protein